MILILEIEKILGNCKSENYALLVVIYMNIYNVILLQLKSQ